MRFFAADIIYPISSAPVTDKVLVAEDDGTIVSIVGTEEIDPAKIERHRGGLLPGFVNTHCHLELSHLRGKFPEKTGLPGFLKQIVQYRKADKAEIHQGMIDADAEMYAQGIVAVGDISNETDTFQVKSESKIFYHTFIELFGFDPARAPLLLKNGSELLEAAASHGIRASLAPHAPYSINAPLVQGIIASCAKAGLPTSVHMLESNDENELYVRSTGHFRTFFREMQMPFDSFFTPTGKTSLESILPWFGKEVPTLLVHNTIATAWDADWAEAQHPGLFWCFCPNANRFIEDRLPDIPMLMQHVQHITIGTDSLASNHQLSVLSELQTIQSAYPEIPNAELLRWATLNGALFLGVDDSFGSFDPGKRPGVVLLQSDDIAHSLDAATVSRLL